MHEAMKLLGCKVRDKVTGFDGVVESISFDLYGCVQAVVRPTVDKKKPGEIPDGRWFDTSRLEALGKPVMQPPTFDPPPTPRRFEEVRGPAEKPRR